MDRLANRANGLREILDPMHTRHIAGFEMHFGHAAVIARDEAIEDFREKPPLVEAEAPHDAEIHGGQPSLRVDEQIALMHVGVKKAVPHGVAQEGLNDDAAKIRQVIMLARRAPECRTEERHRSIRG